MAQIDYAPTSKIQPAGWYVVKTTTGKIGIVLHHALGQIHLGPASNGTTSYAIQITPNTSLSMPALLSQFGPHIQNAFQANGATAKQAESLMVQADTAAGKDQSHPIGGIFGFLTGLVGATPTTGGQNTTQLLIGPSGSPTASSGTHPVSTTPSGDAQSVGSQAPSLPGLGSIGTWALRIGEALLGAVLLILGLHALTGNSASAGQQVKVVRRYVPV